MVKENYEFGLIDELEKIAQGYGGSYDQMMQPPQPSHTLRNIGIGAAGIGLGALGFKFRKPLMGMAKSMFRKGPAAAKSQIGNVAAPAEKAVGGLSGSVPIAKGTAVAPAPLTRETFAAQKRMMTRQHTPRVGANARMRMSAGSAAPAVTPMGKM